jgi:hypothetical protein
MQYVVVVLVRLAWSLTIGLAFFVVGLLLYLVLDIFVPKSDLGVKVLTKLYEWGSCYWFKGIKVKFKPRKPRTVAVGTEEKLWVILNDGSTEHVDRATKEEKAVVAEWDDYMGRIRRDSGLPGRWVDDEERRMSKTDWDILVKLKLLAAGILQDGKGQEMSPKELERREAKCIARIIEWQKNE